MFVISFVTIFHFIYYILCWKKTSNLIPLFLCLSAQAGASQLLAKEVVDTDNMPERVEFEISFDGCEEESEE